MRVGVIAVLACLALACLSGAIAQDQTVITNGLTQIAKELCKDDSGLFYFPDGLGWQVYPLNYWQPMWIDFSEYPSLQDLKSRAIASTNRCVLGQVFYGVQPLHVTVTLDLLSGDLILSPGCSSEVLATNSAPAGCQPGQWPVDCRVVERLWQQWQSVQSDPDWQEWYGVDSKPFLTVHFQLADLINDKPTYEENLAAETAAWEEFVLSGGAMLVDSEESGGMSMMMMQGDACDTNEFTILDIQTDDQGWVTVGWCAASNVVYQIQAAPEMPTNTAWEAQALYVGEGYASWTDTNAPAFPYRFYRCRALPGNEDADGDGLSNMAEFNLGTGIDNPDTDGDGIIDGNEAMYGTNPLNPDSDSDFWLDGAEILQGYNPTNSANFPDFSFTVNGGADVVTNAQLHIDLAAGLIADYTIVSEDITFASSITNALASTFDYTLGNTNDGMHMVFLVLLKAGGTTSPQFGRTFELDTHPPSLTINSPTNSFITSRRRINVEGFAADAATNAPQLDASRPLLITINGIAANDRDTNGVWRAGPLDLLPGTNEFFAVATDRAGFIVSNSVWFIYDATLATNVPVFTVDVTNSVVVGSNATTIAVSGTIDDDNATIKIDLLDVADGTITNASVSAAVQGTNWWAEIPVMPGSNIVVVSAQNGSSLPATNGFTMIQDTNVFLEITSPAANSAINTAVVTVAGIANTNFDGAITINGSPASTSLTSSGIVFSGTVPINNIDANVIEVTATGTDGSSAVVRQLVYGYEVVAFNYRYWYYYKHLTDDCWYSHHYPTEHHDHGDYYMEETWAAPAAEGSGWDVSQQWGYSGNLRNSSSDTWTWSWNPNYLRTPDTGRIEYHDYRDGKRLHPTYQIGFGFRDGSGFPAECSCQNTYCEDEPTENCWIDSKEETLDVEIGEHETTFVKHWPKDEEQTVILHFKSFYYYDRDTDVTKIKLWGQPGFAYDFVQHTGWVFTNVGFLVKIKTNTRYTLRETDFEWPHTPENATSHSPNAQSTSRYYEDWHAFYYNSFANQKPEVRFARPDSGDWKDLEERQAILFEDETRVKIILVPKADSIDQITKWKGFDKLKLRTSATKPEGVELPITTNTATLVQFQDRSELRIVLTRDQLKALGCLPANDEDALGEKAWYDWGDNNSASTHNLDDGKAFDAGSAAASRGQSTKYGTLKDAPPNSPLDKTFLKAAGVELITAEIAETSSEKRQIANQADTFYISTEGHIATGLLDTQTNPNQTFGPQDAQWNHELKTVIIAGCSVLAIKDFRVSSMTRRDRWNYFWKTTGTPSPGEAWENTGPKYLLGYCFTAPTDKQGAPTIISNYLGLVNAGTNAVAAWGQANAGTKGVNACAIDTSVSPHQYWHFKNVNGSLVWTNVIKGGSGW